MKFTTASVTLRYCHNGGISDAVPERPTRRCSGRAQRDKIERILRRDFLLSVSSIQTARR